MKKLFAALLSAAMVFSLAACNANSSSSSKMKVGISMPTQSLQRWNYDGANLKKDLEGAGFSATLQYANNDVNTQVQQCENMITQGCKVLVIAAVEGSSFSDVCDTAHKHNVKVIAYDRLLMKTGNVDYYATFDNYKVGQAQGNYLVDALKLTSASGPFNIEIFAGDPGDNNAPFFYKGAMDVLNPYISNGKLVVKSGEKDFNTCAIANWTTATAQSRMDNLITKDYSTGVQLDAVLSPNDSLALGIEQSLLNHGYGTGGKNFPIVTGQDCDIANVKNIVKGYQALSVWKDTRKLADQVTTMITDINEGKTVPVNNTTDYNNGVKNVPTYLLTIDNCTKDNYKALLVDSGYYTASQLSD